MWQFLLAAAVTGCGLFAKRFLIDVDPLKASVSEQEKNGPAVERKEEEEFVDPVKPEVLISSLGVSSRVPSEICDSGNSEIQNLVIQEEGIFRFSSLDRGDGSGSRSSSKGLLKKVGSRRNVESVSNRSVRVEKIDRKLSFMDDDDEVEEQRKKGRKFSVYLKRRRTCKNAFRRCGSCSSRGDSFFGFGLGLGIMYMVSAGKAEINKMNEAVEETTKVVNNLKCELQKRKLSRNLQNPRENRIDGCPNETVGENKQLPVKNSCMEGASLDDTKAFCVTTDDGESASSVLTEEPELEVLEVDQLEAELESELLKIPFELDPEHLVEVVSTEVSANAFPAPHESLCMDSKPFPFHGVSPSELDRELCHLLIEQQESQILELESNLYSSQLKLHEKESELQRLKDVVHRLRDFKLETVSDVETENAEVINDVDAKNSKADLLTSSRLVADGCNKRLITEPKPVCGMKRVMEFESCDDCRLSCNAVDSSSHGLSVEGSQY